MSSATPRIDVHHHLTPPVYATGIAKHFELQGPLRNWSVARSIEDMDRGGVSTAIVSVTTPGFWFGDRQETAALARASNDYAAGLVRDHPGRFGMFTALPLPDVDASLREIEYGLDVLKADGVCVFTNYRDRWIGQKAFDPVFDELNRRRAVVHVHPDTPDCCRNIGRDIGPDDDEPTFRPSVVEYAADTSRAIAHVLFSGTAHRCPDIRFIWSHAGGTMPFTIERFTREPLANLQLRARLPDGVLNALKRFHYDTAQAAHANAMASLTQLVPASQILFGTDFPFRSSADNVQGLSTCGCFSDADLRAIDAGNAQRLMPRLKQLV